MVDVYLLKMSGVTVQNFISLDDACVEGEALARRSLSGSLAGWRFAWHTTQAGARWHLFLKRGGDSLVTHVELRRYHP